jgi:hypothetical protein
MESLRSATDRFLISLVKAETDLKGLTHRIEEEFEQRYADKEVRGRVRVRNTKSSWLSVFPSASEILLMNSFLYTAHIYFRFEESLLWLGQSSVSAAEAEETSEVCPA